MASSPELEIEHDASGEKPEALLRPALSRGKTRLWNLLWTCSASAPLLIAGMLHPSENGVGTHQQLGLPPCTFLWVTGFPCPFCGMTTSWSFAAHFDIVRSIRTQPAGFALFVACLAFVPWLIALTVSGRVAFRPEIILARIPIRVWYGIFFALTLAWIFKIASVRGWIVA